MRKLLPVILALIGIGAGGAAGYFLRPPPAEEPAQAACSEAPCPEPEAGHDAEASAEHAPAGAGEQDQEEAAPTEFVKLNNQFIVPDIQKGSVVSLVVLSLSIEVSSGTTDRVFMLEPKLRDIFLQVLFDRANVGGFRGDFTSSERMDELRRALLEAARKVIGPEARNVLISDIVRQDTA